MTYLYVKQSSSLFGGGGAIPPLPVERKPVHITDMRTFMQCRRKWNWESLIRMGLQPSLMADPLFLGIGVHIGLDYGYQRAFNATPSRFEFNARDAVRAFSKWANQRIAAMVAHTGELWEDEQTRYDKLIQLGQVMLTHYGLWVPPHDEAFELLGLEKRFSTPVPNTKAVCYEGRFDGLLQHKHTKELYVMEFKTSAYMTKERLAGVFRDMQPIAYQWAAKQVYQQPVAGVLYRILWKKEPGMPRVTAHNNFSRDKRQHISEVWLDHCIQQMADTPESTESILLAARGLRQMIREKGEQFFMQKAMKSLPHQEANLLSVLKVIGGDMTNPRTPIFPMSGYHCSFCRFKDPCDLLQHNHPELAQEILAAEYARREYWEDYILEAEEKGT